MAFDVGNSSVRFAHVCGDDVRPVQTHSLSDTGNLGGKLATTWKAMPPPKKLAACSVNPDGLKVVEDAAAASIGEPVLVVGRDLPLPMATDLPSPEQIGADRLCAAVAAFDRLGAACVVADFGTAITIDCVNNEGVFMGGAILPGLSMGAEGLSARTAALPRVQPARPGWVYGKDTRQAIVGGLVFGARGALRELVEAYATELGHWPVVVTTGGDAELVCGDPNRSELIQAIVPDLVIRGVAMAYYKTLDR